MSSHDLVNQHELFGGERCPHSAPSGRSILREWRRRFLGAGGSAIRTNAEEKARKESKHSMSLLGAGKEIH